MSNFSIGIMADSLKLSFADSMKKARELGADGFVKVITLTPAASAQNLSCPFCVTTATQMLRIRC